MRTRSPWDASTAHPEPGQDKQPYPACPPPADTGGSSHPLYAAPTPQTPGCMPGASLLPSAARLQRLLLPYPFNPKFPHLQDLCSGEGNISQGLDLSTAIPGPPHFAALPLTPHAPLGFTPPTFSGASCSSGAAPQNPNPNPYPHTP